MAQRDQVGRALRRHDSGDACDAERVALWQRLVCAAAARPPPTPRPGRVAVAVRTETSLAETSTIRAAPDSSRWVKPPAPAALIAGAARASARSPPRRRRPRSTSSGTTMSALDAASEAIRCEPAPPIGRTVYAPCSTESQAAQVGAAPGRRPQRLGDPSPDDRPHDRLDTEHPPQAPAGRRPRTTRTRSPGCPAGRRTGSGPARSCRIPAACRAASPPGRTAPCRPGSAPP